MELMISLLECVIYCAAPAQDHELWHYMSELAAAREEATESAARQAELEQARPTPFEVL